MGGYFVAIVCRVLRPVVVPCVVTENKPMRPIRSAQRPSDDTTHVRPARYARYALKRCSCIAFPQPRASRRARILPRELDRRTKTYLECVPQRRRTGHPWKAPSSSNLDVAGSTPHCDIRCRGVASNGVMGRAKTIRKRERPDRLQRDTSKRERRRPQPHSSIMVGP